ncbi:MAG: tail fiber domain-containing protein [Ignavibacteria bacterium]
MKTKIFVIIICNLIICCASGELLIAQSINGKLGSGGQFIIRDTTNTFLTLSQSTGELSLNRSLLLPVTTQNSQLGSIFKGTVRFLHNFSPTTAPNTFLGLNSGNFTMNGAGSQSSYNTGIGANSLGNLTTGYENSALGQTTLNSNTTGYENSAFGSFSLGTNSTGYQNSAFGRRSMNNNSTGNQNSAFGYNALYSNFTGFQNTAIGYNSLVNNSGNYNTALGYNSGSTITTGANLTCIGTDAAPTTPTAIDQVTLGNGFVNSLRCNVQTITSLSDKRDKKNIKELSLGLDFITKLKPRQFNWDKREWYDDNTSDGSKMKETPTAGFIAQELDEVQTSQNADWLNLVLKDNPEKWEATYGNLLPVMVKAIQELKAENDELKDKLANFEQTQSMLVSEIEKLKAKDNETREVKLTGK